MESLAMPSGPLASHIPQTSSPVPAGRSMLPKAFEGRRAILHVDHIDDADDAWVDGKRVGGTTAFEKDFWCKPRDYAFMLEATPDGLHTVVFRVQNHFGVGSLLQPQPRFFHSLPTVKKPPISRVQ